MSYVKIWLHAVWGTKGREPILEENIRAEVCSHIISNAAQKKFFIDCADGYTDHLHCLMNLNADISVSKQMQLIKGESSLWINKTKLIKGHFEWADEYFAVSVSEDKIDNVRAYIHGQKEHHKKVTFLEEYNNFLRHFKFYGGQG